MLIVLFAACVSSLWFDWLDVVVWFGCGLFWDLVLGVRLIVCLALHLAVRLLVVTCFMLACDCSL